MANFIVETTVVVYSPKDWKFRVETTIMFKVGPAEQKLKKEFSVIFFELFMKRHLKIEEGHEKVKVVKEGTEEGCESEGREL